MNYKIRKSVYLWVLNERSIPKFVYRNVLFGNTTIIRFLY